MVFHMIFLAKLKLLSSPPSRTVVSPILSSFLCPFLVKLTFGLRFSRRCYVDGLHSLRLFVFQLQQIAFDDQGHHRDPPAINGNGNGSRWERAIRLVCRRVTLARRVPASQLDEDNFHALTVLSL